MRFSPMDFSSARSLPRWLAVSVLAAPLTGYSQPELIADLSLLLAPPLPAVIAPGASGTIQITVLNDGPDDAGFTSKVDNPLVVRTSLQMQRPDGGIDVRFFPPDPADECILIATVVDPPPGGRPQWSYGVFFKPIAAGNSATCLVRYALDPLVVGQQIPITWRVRTFTETDPNPANDTFPLVFNVGLPAPPAPVPLMAFWSLLLLSGLVLYAGSIAARRHS